MNHKFTIKLNNNYRFDVIGFIKYIDEMFINYYKKHIETNQTNEVDKLKWIYKILTYLYIYSYARNNLNNNNNYISLSLIK